MYTSAEILLATPLPLPDLPTNLRSLNLATWPFMAAVLFLSSPQKLSSLPTLTLTVVPSLTSFRATTRNDVGRDLLDRQCPGIGVQRMFGESVFMSSPPGGSTPPPMGPPRTSVDISLPGGHVTVMVEGRPALGLERATGGSLMVNK